MPYQPGLFPPEDPKPVPAPLLQPRNDAANSPSPVWLQRMSVVVLVVFCFYVGLLLFLLPWTRYWNENHYLLTWPFLSPWMSSGFMRGFVSGIGLLDIGIGISEIVHYRERRF